MSLVGLSAETTRAARGRAWAALALAALLFGATFVIVKDALSHLPPFAFIGWRFLLGGAALLLVARPRTAATWRDGLLVGALLFAGYAFQTVGLKWTSVSHSALITGLYVVITPVLAAALARRRVAYQVVVGSLLAFAGLAVLVLPIHRGFGFGDVLTLLCAFAFSGHVVALARTARRHRIVPFTAVQLMLVAALSLATSAAVEGLPLPGREVWLALALTGLGASAGAFLLQVWAQTIAGPTQVALVLALEPVFAMLIAAIVLSEMPGPREALGALLILGGIYLVLFFTGDEDDLVLAEATTEAH